MDHNINPNKNTKYLVGAGIVVASLAIIFLVGSAKNTAVSPKNQTALAVNSVQPTSGTAAVGTIPTGNETVAQRLATLSTATNSTLDLLSGVISADAINQIKIKQTEATVKAILATVPNLDKTKVAELNKLLSTSVVGLDAQTTRAQVAVIRTLFILALTNNPKLPNKNLSDIASTSPLSFDAALYNTQAEYDSYGKYANDEINKYIKTNNIDTTTNFVGRISTKGQKIPGHVFSVPNKYIKTVNINGEKGFFVAEDVPVGIDTGFLLSEKDPTGGYDNNKRLIWPSNFDRTSGNGCWHFDWFSHYSNETGSYTHWSSVPCNGGK